MGKGKKRQRKEGEINHQVQTGILRLHDHTYRTSSSTTHSIPSQNYSIFPARRDYYFMTVQVRARAFCAYRQSFELCLYVHWIGRQLSMV